MLSFTAHESRTEADGSTLMTFSVRVPSREQIGGALEAERSLHRALNAAGACIMQTLLSRYDTDGEPLERAGTWFTSKGRSPAVYQTLSGEVTVERHLYQSPDGGRTFCPLEERARIAHDATLHFGSIIAEKYSARSGRAVVRDLARSHQRSVSLEFVQSCAAHMGEVAVKKEAHWTYAPDTPKDKVHSIVMGADGTCTAICEEGYKQAMAGTFSLLDEQGARLETIHIAHAPEDGKVTFKARMEREAARLKAWDPDITWQGICDGAPDLQDWLQKHCDTVTLDFYHVSEYLAAAAPAFEKAPTAQRTWLQTTLHSLKHEKDGASKILRRLRRALSATDAAPLCAAARPAVEQAVQYMERNLARMDYALLSEAGLVIGSGVTEAACKHIIKERTGGSGMRWKRRALQAVLSLRALVESGTRWEQFLTRIERHGF